MGKEMFILGMKNAESFLEIRASSIITPQEMSDQGETS